MAKDRLPVPAIGADFPQSRFLGILLWRQHVAFPSKIILKDRDMTVEPSWSYQILIGLLLERVHKLFIILLTLPFKIILN
jgi:hypothetical protein